MKFIRKNGRIIPIRESAESRADRGVKISSAVAAGGSGAFIAGAKFANRTVMKHPLKFVAATGLLAAGGVASAVYHAKIRESHMENRFQKQNATEFQKVVQRAKYGLGDAGSMIAGFAAPIAAGAAIRPFAKMASNPANRQAARNAGQTVRNAWGSVKKYARRKMGPDVVKDYYSGPMKDVFSSKKLLR